MSYTDPHFDPESGPGSGSRPRRPRRGPLTVAIAALVPGALLGWLVYSNVGDHDRTQGAGSVRAAGPSADDGRDGDAGAGASASPSTTARADGPLRGRVIVIDPGHNPTNSLHTAEIDRQVDIGTNHKECDTTGTETNSGYAEARFTLDVAHRMRTYLEHLGAKVTLTQDGDRPWGPCVDERARIGNAAHADAVVSVHADGSAAGNRGFHVILPASVHAGGADTRAIVGPSRELGTLIRSDFARETGTGTAGYIGDGRGLVTREDLGGLNLSTVPKVFVECGNMRDSKDAALLTSGAWRQKAALGISEGIVSFLRGERPGR
ncbi:N-acetylmuramoyl-L-alanine amidase [Streptomyces sp. NPDC008150]|uniref:N-acetylmuramoyl-L-alanine amidase n=1 Tax=Streptomyces sp. NPDC008150 TaxID=3364816 RepID=UPI0036EA0F2B